MGIRYSWSIQMLLVAGFVLLSAFWLMETGSGRTITVGEDDSGAEFTQIQNAINASQEGDTIRVFEGTYYENVVIDKRISIMGNGSDLTIIEPNSTNTVIQIKTMGVILSNIGIRTSRFIIKTPEFTGIKLLVGTLKNFFKN